MHKKLDRKFFERTTLRVAKELLGKFLVRRIGDTVIAVKITETEAYCGPYDLACHASKGLTARTKVMFGPPGHAYVYLIYGMYHCLNVVTERDGYPAAVLIRAVELDGADGPGKLCRKLSIDKKLNAADLTSSQELWVEDRGNSVRPSDIKKSPRVGVDYAGSWKDKLWRFWV